METISIGQTVKLINRGRRTILLAAMNAAAFARDHIPGSYRLDLTDDAGGERLLATLRQVRRPRLIVYGQDSEPEAYRAAHELEEYGFDQVLVLDGGLAIWQEAGYATYRDLGEQLNRTQEEVDRALLVTTEVGIR